jgi:hypothetical protein
MEECVGIGGPEDNRNQEQHHSGLVTEGTMRKPRLQQCLNVRVVTVSLIILSGLIAATNLAAQTQDQEAAANAKKFEVASVRLMQDRDKLPIEQQMFYMSPSGAGEFTMRNARLDNLIGWPLKLEDSHIRLRENLRGWIRPITRLPPSRRGILA